MNFVFRDMVPSDLIHLRPLYEAMVNEAKQEASWIPYPGYGNDDGGAFVEFVLKIFREQRNMILRGEESIWKGLVVCHGTVPKGFLTAEIAYRPVGQPKRTILGTLFYVDPGFRKKGFGLELIRRMHEWALERKVEAWEAWYVPGTVSHKMWAKLGFRTFAASGVLVDKDFKPVLDFQNFEEVWKKGKSG